MESGALRRVIDTLVKRHRMLSLWPCEDTARRQEGGHMDTEKNALTRAPPLALTLAFPASRP